MLGAEHKNEGLADPAQRPADHVGGQEQSDLLERDRRVPGKELRSSETEFPLGSAFLQVKADDRDRSSRFA